MAEVVGLLASGAGIASLGGQIFENIYKLQKMISAIQNAPQDVKVLLEEIAIVTNVMVECLERPPPSGIGRGQREARDQALVHCGVACKHLFTTVSEIHDGISGSKYRSKWYSLLTVLKAGKIAQLVARLEMAKTTLALAQLSYFQ